MRVSALVWRATRVDHVFWVELIGLALGLKGGGEGIRSQGYLSYWACPLGGWGWHSLTWGGESRFGGGKAKFCLDHPVSQPVTYQRGGITCKPGTPDTGRGWRDGFKRLGVEIFETVALDQQGMQTKNAPTFKD